MNPPVLISVCVCTYRRSEQLDLCLRGILSQQTDERFDTSLVVIDNDPSGSAQEIVAQTASSSGREIAYAVEKDRNIALARNQAVSLCKGDLVAFIDDDEVAPSNWLLGLLTTLEHFQVDGVLGPVLPRFEITPPDWLTAGGFYQRPRHVTGYKLKWYECRTGNALVKREIFAGLEIPFRPEFGSGGEDQDFFRRAMELGKQFVWCDEAPVDELVPASRCEKGFLVRRALLRGANSARHPARKATNLLKSLCAIPIYSLSLPLLFLSGNRQFTKYLVKLADHVGRLLSVLHLHPIKERPM